MAAAIVFLLLLMSAGSASSSSGCLNATLPGILDLGSCLGTSLELCGSPTEDIVERLTNLVECLITPLMDIDVMGTVSALFEIIRVVLSALDLGLLDLSKVIKPLCEVTSLPGCTTLLTGDQMCAEPISITLPEELNLEQCFSDTLLLCEDGEEATDSVLLKLVDSVACVLQELLTGEDAGNLVQGLACTILDLLNSALGTNPMLRMTLGGLLDTLGETAQCS